MLVLSQQGLPVFFRVDADAHSARIRSAGLRDMLVNLRSEVALRTGSLAQHTAGLEVRTYAYLGYLRYEVAITLKNLKNL